MGEDTKLKRNSSSDLLRIICIILIIAFHFSVHGEWSCTNESLTFNIYLLRFLSIWGRIACDVFILISGYYMVDRKVNWKRIGSVVFTLCFYTWIFALLFFMTGQVRFDHDDIRRLAFPVYYGNWFCVTYLKLILLVPIINLGLKRLKKWQYSVLIFVMLIYWSVIPTFIYNTPFSDKPVCAFVAMYLFGGYCKRYSKKSVIWNWICPLSLVMVTVLVLFDDFTNPGEVSRFVELNQLPAVIVAVSSFMLFNQRDFYNRNISKLAGLGLGIYLIHDNEFVQQLIWNELSPNGNYLNSYFLIFHMIIKVSIVFVLCGIIEWGRIMCTGTIMSELRNKYNRIRNKQS